MPTEWTTLQGIVAFLLSVPIIICVAVVIYGRISEWESNREHRRNSRYVYKGQTEDGTSIYLELPK